MKKREEEPSIRLSKKHGVNPSMALCYYCGDETGEIILPGRLPGDAEAPRKAIWHKGPCKQCAEWMKKGIILISVANGSLDKQEEEPFRTGDMVVVREAGIIKMFGTEHEITRRRCAFVEDKDWDTLGLPRASKGDAFNHES